MLNRYSFTACGLPFVRQIGLFVCVGDKQKDPTHWTVTQGII